MVKKRTRRLCVTLIEMIIVMILIATITGALAYNYQRSLDRGKLFATKQRVERLKAILTLYFSEHPEQVEANTDWINIINDSGLAPPNPAELLKDDFGESFQIAVAHDGDGGLDIRVSSKGAERALRTKSQ